MTDRDTAHGERRRRALYAGLLGFVVMPVANRLMSWLVHTNHWVELGRFTGPALKVLGAIAFVYAVMMLFELFFHRETGDESDEEIDEVVVTLEP
jgi:predicted tellurium resistance membrane protein TerC